MERNEFNFNSNERVRDTLLRRFSCFDGIGEDLRGVGTFEDALKKAGLDYMVEKQKMYLSDGSEVRNYFATVTPDGMQTGVVGNEYHVVNNNEAFSVAKSIVEEGEGTFECGGVGKGAKNRNDYSRNFMVLRHDDINILGDVYNSFSVFRNSFNGSSCVQMQFVNLRLVCLNGMTREMPSQQKINSFFIQHSNSAQRRIEIAREGMKGQRAYVKALQAEAEALATTKLTKTEFENEIIPLVINKMKLNKEDRKRGGERLEETIARIVGAYNASDVQNFNNTAYKVLLTLSDFESHSAPLRNTDNPHLYFNRVLSGMVLTNTAVNHIIRTRGLKVNYK